MKYSFALPDCHLLLLYKMISEAIKELADFFWMFLRPIMRKLSAEATAIPPRSGYRIPIPSLLLVTLGNGGVESASGPKNVLMAVSSSTTRPAKSHAKIGAIHINDVSRVRRGVTDF